MDFLTAPNTNELQSFYTELSNIRTSSLNKLLYCKANLNGNFGKAFQVANFIATEYGIAFNITKAYSVKRSDILQLVLNNYFTYATNGETHSYDNPYLFTTEQRENMELDTVYNIRLLTVPYQITSCFEEILPATINNHNAQPEQHDHQIIELNNISLYLKQDRYHKVRVYRKDNIIYVISNQNVCTNNSKIFFKFLSALPIICGFVETKPKLTDLFKTFIEPAKIFWDKVQRFLINNAFITDIKYRAIINTFNTLKDLRCSTYINKLERLRNQLQQTLVQYSNYLQDEKDTQATLTQIEAESSTLSEDFIKMLCDKKVCYNIDTTFLANSGYITYYTQAFCTNYNKDAAKSILKSYRRNNRFNSVTLRLFEHLFVDEQIALLFTERVRIYFNPATINARYDAFGQYQDFNEIIPNPHHYYYNCWGSYGTKITRLISEYNLEDLFFQIKSAVSSLNMNDPTVIVRFFNEILIKITAKNYTPACLYWADENYKTAHTFEETLEHYADYYKDYLIDDAVDDLGF